MKGADDRLEHEAGVADGAAFDGGKTCERCHYSSLNLAGPPGKHLCWRVGSNSAPGDDEIQVDQARANGMPCGPAGALFEDHDALMWDLEGKDDETWQCLGW